ncbi:transposase of ISAar40, IS3 family, IS3 group, orfA [Arthrobacter nitrophenolicus]|uniref:Transposase n=2 Tax=Arthrobacter nitrophenolicus TaxID=683150 RepID=A0ACC6TKQ6_9MICC|nr:transposase of ISAar40, IS3 family, IS3 group, orfA [Arthrobacter nitrophenolicus]
MSTTRRTFTPEYRREAARLGIDTGRPIAQVARELGLGEQLLGRWVGQERPRSAAPEEFAAAESEKSELERLRRENIQLKIDNEFLGKAAGFFASKKQNRNASN